MAAPLTRSALRSTSIASRHLTSTTPRLNLTNITRNQSPLLRRFYASTSEQPRLRIGSTAPNFTAKTTHGEIDFHAWKKGSWAVLFSHPADFTPVCTTELGAFARFKEEWEAKNIKIIGLSADALGSHEKWLSDIEDVTSARPTFPLIADSERKVAWLYDMVDASETGGDAAAKGLAMTIRSVFIIDPNNKIRLSMMYPASTGRNTAEVARVLEALQTHEKHSVNTPVDWTLGKDVIVPPAVSTEDARKKFGDVKEDKPYLRWVKV